MNTDNRFAKRARWMTLDQIAGTVCSVCKHYPSVIAAYLFGSVVKKTPDQANDIDVAVLLNDTYAFCILSFITDLEILLKCRADVVVLNKSGELLKFQVRKYGKLIYDLMPEKRISFEKKSRKLYEDFLYLHQRYVRKVLYADDGSKAC